MHLKQILQNAHYRPGPRFSKVPERELHFKQDVYTSPFLDTDELKIMARVHGPQKFPGLSKNGPQDTL